MSNKLPAGSRLWTCAKIRSRPTKKPGFKPRAILRVKWCVGGEAMGWNKNLPPRLFLSVPPMGAPQLPTGCGLIIITKKLKQEGNSFEK